MIRLLLIALVLFLAGCSSGPGVPAKIVAPTVPTLTPVAPASTREVSERVARQSERISSSRAANDQASRIVEAVTQQNTSLRGQLESAIAEGQASREELERMHLEALAEARSHDVLRQTIVNQRSVLDDLEEINASLMKEVTTLTEQVSVSNQRIVDLGELLVSANSNIQAVTEKQHEASDAAAKNSLRAESFKTSYTVERKWKWIFFAWGSTTTLFLIIVAAATFHPGIPFGFKLI